LNKMSIPSYGLRLPVNFSSSTGERPSIFDKSPFLIDSTRQHEFLITHGLTDTGKHSLRFNSRTGLSSPFVVTGDDLSEVILKLANEVYAKPK